MDISLSIGQKNGQPSSLDDPGCETVFCKRIPEPRHASGSEDSAWLKLTGTGSSTVASFNGKDCCMQFGTDGSYTFRFCSQIPFLSSFEYRMSKYPKQPFLKRIKTPMVSFQPLEPQQMWHFLDPTLQLGGEIPSVVKQSILYQHVLV